MVHFDQRRTSSPFEDKTNRAAAAAPGVNAASPLDTSFNSPQAPLSAAGSPVFNRAECRRGILERLTNACIYLGVTGGGSAIVFSMINGEDLRAAGGNWGPKLAGLIVGAAFTWLIDRYDSRRCPPDLQRPL